MGYASAIMVKPIFSLFRGALILDLALLAVAARPAVGDERVDALLGQMTLEEKLGQLTQLAAGDAPSDADTPERRKEAAALIDGIRSGAVGALLNATGAEYTNSLQRVAVEQSRLKIPLLLGFDVIHGYRTIFPIPLGEAAAWDADLAERTAHAAATEARAAGIHWTFAPMVDIARDPRWGRIAEGAGEDPFLGSAIAAARVRGFQGDDVARPDRVLACAKHFAAYGAAEGGRDYNTVDISEQTLREVYLPPFRAAVDAGVGSLMCAFNEINGVPCSANAWLLRRVLRDEWRFDGLVVSDWTSIKELTPHGVAADLAEAAQKALSAGVDLDMCSEAYRKHIADAVQRGDLPLAPIDEAVRRVLRAKQRLGLFERPFAEAQRERDVTLSAEHRRLAREAAGRSMVLLKNERQTLPLRADLKSIAVIGPLADNRRDVLGTWAARGRPEDVVTVLEGVRARAPAGVAVRYAKGCELDDRSTEGIAEAVAAARESDVALLFVGEGEMHSGEGHSRSTLDLPGVQEDLVRAVHATGVPTVVVLMNGRPLSIAWIAENVPAILEAWHPGVECGHAVADVLFGDVNPGGKLPVTFPRRVGQVPIHYAHKNTGRPPSDDRFTSKYIDLPSTPLYPFGWGLSYTQFVFDNLRVEPERVPSDGRVAVSVDVRNTGDRAGHEVVQLYVRDEVASMTRPVKQLRGFRRVALRPGESQTVRLELPVGGLGFYDREMKYVVEPGVFRVWVGPNSAEGLSATLEVTPPAPESLRRW